ncbi:unnamed protein product [Paramecium octaurelia]|uniref:Uncharacterized protein n=1 Tax=Paramecium octaurelia TaxID=43137 RepID=A0A8S1YAA4_PAROT|nr:unnamed protein product [Paramecium octaurelia]
MKFQENTLLLYCLIFLLHQLNSQLGVQYIGRDRINKDLIQLPACCEHQIESLNAQIIKEYKQQAFY